MLHTREIVQLLNRGPAEFFYWVVEFKLYQWIKKKNGANSGYLWKWDDKEYIFVTFKPALSATGPQKLNLILQMSQLLWKKN